MNTGTVVKALECCENTKYIMSCDECPLRNTMNCNHVLNRAALTVITELVDENGRLQDLVKELQQYNEAWVEDNGKLRLEIKRLKSEIEKVFDDVEDCVVGIFEPSFQELRREYTERNK